MTQMTFNWSLTQFFCRASGEPVAKPANKHRFRYLFKQTVSDNGQDISFFQVFIFFPSEENAIKALAELSGGYYTTESNNSASVVFAFSAWYTYCSCSSYTPNDSPYPQDWHILLAGSVFYSFRRYPIIPTMDSYHKQHQVEEKQGGDRGIAR